jgi:spore maturation protein CgeB
MAKRGHRVVFFERDTPYYAEHRDMAEIPNGELFLYSDWNSVLPTARKHLAGADAGMVTSFCPDGVAASSLVLSSPAGVRVFYDLDTPVTLERLRGGQPVSYIGPRGLRDFDLVLSYTGGAALKELQEALGARRVAPLYGSVDPSVHFPVPPLDPYRSGLSYLGTYAEDRQSKLENLFIEPARLLPGTRFSIGGAMYPSGFPWRPNIFFLRHLAPPEHAAFYCSSKLTLNVTRGAMASMGFCPSGRLFEAAACGVPILSDQWEGLDQFFQPGSEILVARTTEDVVEALGMPPGELERIGAAGRERALDEHTADHRCAELEAALDRAFARV